MYSNGKTVFTAMNVPHETTVLAGAAVLCFPVLHLMKYAWEVTPLGNSKFTLNALILVIIVVTGIGFFFTVAIVDLAYHPAVNDFHPIEGTDLGVLYSSIKPNGIYEGDRVNNVLKLEGKYGFDWGVAVEGNCLYTNEYSSTALGIILSNVVRIDLDTFEKKVLLTDAVLRGRCVSGELVCQSGALLESNYPEDNSLCRLYAVSAPWIDPKSRNVDVIWLDPGSSEELFRLQTDRFTGDFDADYLQRNMEEVRQ